MDPLAEAYDRHAAALYRFLVGLLMDREDAADVLQEVFVKLARRGLDGIETLEGYLFAAARNEAYRHLARRAARRAADRVISERGSVLAPADGATPGPGEREALEAALAALPDEQREVVVLHIFEGRTFAEVASLLDIPQNTAASRFRYAREKLKDLLP